MAFGKKLRVARLATLLGLWAGLSSTLAGADAAQDREERKLKFLAKPVFKNQQPREKTKAAAPALAKAPNHTEDCGVNSYLGHYCFKPVDAHEWKLCTDRWGGCIQSRRR